MKKGEGICQRCQLIVRRRFQVAIHLHGQRLALHGLSYGKRAEHGGFIRFEVECGQFLPAGTVIARTRDIMGNEVEAIAMPADGYVMTFPPQSWVGNQAVATGDLIADLFS